LLLALPGAGVPAAQSSEWVTPAAVEPLSAGEEHDPVALEIARRFNPTMALPDGDGPWPVAVRYSWGGGADLQARTVDGKGAVLRTARAFAGAELDRRAWDELPVQDADGNRIEYWIDAPGDDRVSQGISDWRRRWRAATDKTPTQYAHLFWLNRDRGELVVQYWFFYPFNEWINHHEGDWEHVNVVLSRRPAAGDRPASASPLGRASDYRAVGYEYYFHGFRLETERPMRVADHPVVFVGGRGRLLWWAGTQSGGSYPWPASYPGAGGRVGPFAASDDTRGPVRVMEADRFDVVMLPEPARLDARRHPELSWLRLPFFAGQPRVFENPPLMDRFGGGKPPRQPARRPDWNSVRSRPLWSGIANLE
jgi:hypothetical protein